MRIVLALAVLACLQCLPTAASAEPQANAAKAKADADASNSLFYDARALMKEGRYAEACPKLEQSLRLDGGLGTQFNLADCYEHMGKIASAWSGFTEVATAANISKQTAREELARQRARALETRVPKLIVEVEGALPALEVTRDGIPIGASRWGTDLPLDPGSHVVGASAPGAQPWRTTFQAKEGEQTRVRVPRLLPAPREVGAQAGVQPFPEPVTEERGRTQRTLGWVAGGVGFVGVGIGIGFGLDSLANRNLAKSHCEGDLCDAQGVAFRDRAIRSGDVATGTMIAGGAALLGGIILVLTAPSGPERPIRATPQIARGGAGILIEGVLP